MTDYFSLEYWTEPTSVVLLAGLAIIGFGVFLASQPYGVQAQAQGLAFGEALPSTTRSRDSIPVPVYGVPR